MTRKLGRKRYRKHSKIYLVDESTGAKTDITDVFEVEFAGKWGEYEKLTQKDPEAAISFLKARIEQAFFTVEDIL